MMDHMIVTDRLLNLFIDNARLDSTDNAQEHDPPTFGNSCADCGGQVQQMSRSELGAWANI
jgi:hypothetical protein